MDSHSSHDSVECFWITTDHSISFICFPAYSTHILDHLDIQIFDSLANRYILELDNWQESGNIKIYRQAFLERFILTREKVYT